MIECDIKDCGYRLCNGYRELVCPYCMVPFTKAAKDLISRQLSGDQVSKIKTLLDEAYKALDDPHDMKNISAARGKLNAINYLIARAQ